MLAGMTTLEMVWMPLPDNQLKHYTENHFR